MLFLGQIAILEGHPLPVPEWMRLLYGLLRLVAAVAVVGVIFWLMARRRKV